MNTPNSSPDAAIEPQTNPAPGCSDYLASLDKLVKHHIWLPQGWYPIYFDMIRSLRAVDSHVRSDLKLSGIEMELGVPNILLSRDDPVVRGIVRRAVRKTTVTCEVCTRQGRPRNASSGWRTLCSSCAGVRQLHQELDAWIASMEGRRSRCSKQIFIFDAMPHHLREAIPAYVWHRVKIDHQGTEIRFVFGSEVVELLPTLQGFRNSIADMLEE